MNTGEKLLMKGNEAIAEAAIRAGCRFYAGYPITPQNEITAAMAKKMREQTGGADGFPPGVFIQAESEVAAVNMVYGAAAAGARAMTSSSSPGVSLKQEGISYAAGADIPMVVINVSRGGPGLGSIAPAQSDYFQSTRGGGHGDYRCIVLAPKSVQECADLTFLAFNLADKWRVPVILLADGLVGQMMEGVVLPPPIPSADIPPRDWTAGNRANAAGNGANAAGGGVRAARHITSLHLDVYELDEVTRARFCRYEQIAREETRWETVPASAAAPAAAASAAEKSVVIAAYGSSFRSSLGARALAEQAGIRLDLFRPITLWPFPSKPLADYAAGRPILVVEMSQGQMTDDVKIALYQNGYSRDNSSVHILGHSGGVIISEEEIFEKVKSIVWKQ